jgi:dinuclear metal center YbgI/SA1388 family protein
MQIGDTGRDIQSVLLTTDVTPEVVNEAVMCGCQLIVSHHPLLFHGLKQVCGQTPQACVVEMAIKHDIAVYSAHTNLDVAAGGINTRLAQKLGLTGCRPLENNGLGAIGQLPQPMPYEQFRAYVRDILGTTYMRYTRAHKETVQTVALCGGSGAEFIGNAIEQGADVYLTADCKYHDFQDADGRIGLIDIDHWISERHAREIFLDILTPLGVRCVISQTDKTPIQIMKI